MKSVITNSAHINLAIVAGKRFLLLVLALNLSFPNLYSQICPDCVANNCDYCWDWGDWGNDDTIMDTGGNGGYGPNWGPPNSTCAAGACSTEIYLGGGFFSSCFIMVTLVKTPSGGNYCICSGSAFGYCTGYTAGEVTIIGHATYLGGGSVSWRATATYALLGFEGVAYHTTDHGVASFPPSCYQGCL